MYSITYKATQLNNGDTTRPVLSGLSAESAESVIRYLLGLTEWVIQDVTVVTMRGELVAADRGPLMDTRPVSFIRKHAGL
jgi:hypothetical protein